MTTNIIHLRVSKEEKTLQDLEPQREAILKKYNLDPKECIIIEERGSAYNIDKLYRREDFLNLIDIIFNSKETTIHDLFLKNHSIKDINYYVWDYHRIMRNFEFSLLFSLLSDFFSINIYSYKQGKINKKEKETPIDKFARYIFSSINAFSSEDYSYNISTNVKKSIRKEKDVTISSKGNKWGAKFNGTHDNPRNDKNGKVELSTLEITKLNDRIISLSRYYKKKGIKFHYERLINKIKKEFAINISKPYITKIKKRGIKDGNEHNRNRKRRKHERKF